MTRARSPAAIADDIAAAVDQDPPGLRRWCPHEPTTRQRVALASTARELLYGGAAGGGKALATDTPIPTPDGWTTMGALRPGDSVLSPSGQPVRVLAVSGWMLDRECYELTCDDGARIVADAAHLWPTRTAAELSQLAHRTDTWRAARRAKRLSRATGSRGVRVTAMMTERNRLRPPQSLPPPRPMLRTTEAICATLRTKSGRTNHAIDLAAPVLLPDADLPVDPYVLGAWLGDGTSRSAGFTSADEWIVDEIRRRGYSVTKAAPAYAWTIGEVVRVRGRRGRHNTLVMELSALGVLGQKHVPPAYMRGSVAQRSDLLRGLMDTDGSADADGRVEFTNTNQVLADAVFELAASLGQKPTICVGRATLRGRDCGAKYRVTFTPTLPVFGLPRKLARIGRAPRASVRRRFVVDCQRVESVPVQCIQVDGDGMFLAGRQFVPTHNSDLLLMSALEYVDVPGYAAILFRRTYTDLALPGAIMDRAHDWLGGTAATWTDREKTWTFPSGATLSFGYLDGPRDRYRYQGSEVQFCGFDELTQFDQRDYLYLFSRQRRAEGSAVPLRMRAASNPGDIGHRWVRDRFVVNTAPDREFVPALVSDNPHIDAVAYRESLAKLDPVTRRQLEHGEWIEDSSSLVYTVDQSLNVTTERPPERDGWLRILGIDFGVVDETAFCVVAFHEHEPEAWVLESQQWAGMSPSDAADMVKEWRARFGEFARIVADVGGLGKGFQAEMIQRHALPIEPAEKQNKLGYIKLLNGDMSRGHVRIVRDTNTELLGQAAGLLWKNGDRTAEHPSCPNHLTDALLYSWRAARHYAWAQAPEVDTGPGAEALARFAAMRERYESEQEDAWGFDAE